MSEKSAAKPSRAGGTPARERKLRAQGRRTLRKLLDAGREVFERKGYRDTRVDDVAQAAGTSHGTFYLYFANKEELFEALAADVAEEMEALADELGPIDAGATGYATLRDWLDRFAALYGHHAPIISVWQSNDAPRELLRLGRDVLGDLVEVLAKRVAESAASSDIDPDTAAVAFVSLIERFTYLVTVRQLHLRRDTMLDTLARILHTGFFGGRVA
ncbi:MAG: TetR/AcrR family transcriptional regulator [Acidimicrobiia bacterium]|nr:TetR/AcrR family transcriptional regulator [Acidimicrobiia bacterium]